MNNNLKVPSESGATGHDTKEKSSGSSSKT